ncbi:unnamed protein product [Lymnaea stagnalis]|uniref:Death domain-containing protein n=1 Tax=Lymnaea stagnalis TaxID=6523 RepID=A0AAV2HI14_LYMST
MFESSNTLTPTHKNLTRVCELREPMAPPTSLHFFRKRQTFDALASERPQCLQSVYSIVKEVVSSIETRVRNLEASYYEPIGTVEADVKQWQIPLQLVLRPARYSGLVSMQQLSEIAERHADTTDSLKVDDGSLTLVQSLVNKALKAIREGFSESIFFVQKLLEYMKKYCVSFSPHEGDVYLDTATNYEKQRRDLEKTIRMNIESITQTADKFESDSLTIHHFNPAIKEMAERLRIEHSPIALAFTAACKSMRSACRGLVMWVDADSVYPEYLHYDIVELEEKKEIQTRIHRDAQLKANVTEFNAKVLKKCVRECEEEMKRLKPKEIALQEEEKNLRAASKDVLEDLTIKEYRKMEMKLTGSIGDRESQERLELLQSEILELRSRKPAIERRIADLEKQQAWISSREAHREQKEKELERASQELRNCRRHARKAEVELQRVEACLAKLKEIHLIKTSSETLKKIFHNMPVYSRLTNTSKNKKDRLQTLCGLVASELDGDWTRLYRCLPFYPRRGDETVSADIDDITGRFLRNTKEQAQQALSRWRRMHTRACVGDLKEALVAIKRKDILEKFEQHGKKAALRRERTMSPKVHRVVHFPKLSTVGMKRKQNTYLQF